MDQKTIHVIIEGKVQGVFFREYTRREAVKAGVTGWVRNKSDGTVEAIVSGPSSKVEHMQKWFAEGSPHSTVLHVSVETINPSDTFQDFTIRF